MDSSSNQTLPTITHVNEHAILIEWPEKICEKQHQHIVNCQLAMKHTLAENCIETIVSYASLMVYYRFDFFIEHYGADATHHINQLLQNIIKGCSSTNDLAPYSTTSASTITNEVIEIPVYYGEEAGWDLNEVAHRTSLSITEVIDRHTQTTYRAFALGFTPGFCYLGTLPAALALPRKESPRLAVPKGAIAIAEKQTAVYPNSSPGGWHIIGQTPLDMTSIHPTNNRFNTTISVGDNVKFIAINKEKFLTLGGVIQTEVLNKHQGNAL